MKRQKYVRFLPLFVLITLLLPGCSGIAQAIAAENPAIAAKGPALNAEISATAASPADARPQSSSPTVSSLHAVLDSTTSPADAAVLDSAASTTPLGEISLSQTKSGATREAGQPNHLTETPTPAPRSAASLSPEHWQQWPVLPAAVSDELREIYRQGLARGNDPHAFSILGDCQSQPEVFMGIYDDDPAFVRGLPPRCRKLCASSRAHSTVTVRP